MHNYKQPKILIVDDEDYTRLLYEANFKMSGYSVSLATNGSEVIATLKREKPNLVILDVDLPDKNGFEALGAIRKISPDVPIIVNTGYVRFRADVRCWVADAFMIKSSNVEELMAKAAELMKGQKPERVPMRIENIENHEISK